MKIKLIKKRKKRSTWEYICSWRYYEGRNFRRETKESEKFISIEESTKEEKK